MVRDGDDAPDFTAPLANGDIEGFTLADHLDNGPVVLAFFPGAFSRVCTGEMRTIDERLDVYDAVGATVYGVSVDSPFALNAFREDNDLDFAFISDANREIIKEYDVSMDFEEMGLYEFAQRAVFVIDDDGEVTYAWIGEPSTEPDYDEVEAAAEAAAGTAA
jgi:peroxiredoxin